MSWYPIDYFNGDLISKPVSATSWGVNRLDIFGISNPQGGLLGPRVLRQWWWDGTVWNGPFDHPGRYKDISPIAVSWGSNRIDVFGIGADDQDGRVLHRRWDGRTWWGPEALPGEHGLLSNAPLTAVCWGENRIDVFGISNPRPDLFGSRRLLHWWWDGRWNGPADHGGRLRDVKPCAVSWGSNRLDVFAVGADENDGRLLRWSWDGRHWEGPIPLNGEHGLLSNAGLSGVCWGRNRIDVFGISNPRPDLFGARRLLHWWWDGSWNGPADHGGPLLDVAPSAVSWGANRLDIFATAADSHEGGIVLWTWDGAWFGPSSVQIGLSNENPKLDPNGIGPAAVTWGTNRLDVFVPQGNQLGHTGWDPWYSVPSSPRITSTSAAPSYVELEWIDDSPTTIRFEILRADPPFSTLDIPSNFNLRASVARDSSQRTHRYTDNFVDPGRYYCYRVLAVDALGGRSLSNEESQHCISTA